MADNMKKKMLPVGVEDFSEFKTNDFYYIDKTGMIKEFLGNWGKVNLFTRPRRFGKSLNMSMLKCFFDINTDKSLFDGLEISQNADLCDAYMGKYPVIFISLKGIDGETFDKARSLIVMAVNELAREKRYLLDSTVLSEDDKEAFSKLLADDMEDKILYRSLRTLSEMLERHHHEKTIILIDEYDVPLSKANNRGYYDRMVMLIRGIFEQALKTNPFLHFAVLTGCLRITRESLFTGLNNFNLFTLADDMCAKWFGFTDDEVRTLLDDYDLSDYYAITKEWYDGYEIGGVSMYNPWDVICWVNQLCNSRNNHPRNFWANTSSNEELRRFIHRLGDGVTKLQIEKLISGETINKHIEQQLTYDTMYDSVENMWGLLFSTGYLTQCGIPSGETLTLRIPNNEFRNIFNTYILDMFCQEVKKDGTTLDELCEALKNGQAENVQRLLTSYMGKTVGIRDTFVKKELKESFYHGILLGILGFKEEWNVDSNRESGDGYSDIFIEIESEEIGIIIEVKYAENKQFESECAKAMQQIKDMRYTARLVQDGMKKVLKYGIACWHKECQVVCEKD